MNMRCSAYMRTADERQAYIDERLSGLMGLCKVADDDKERFLALSEIRKVNRVLKSVNMTVSEIMEYLGEGFGETRAWEVS